MPLVGTAPGVC